MSDGEDPFIELSVEGRKEELESEHRINLDRGETKNVTRRRRAARSPSPRHLETTEAIFQKDRLHEEHERAVTCGRPTPTPFGEASKAWDPTRHSGEALKARVPADG